MAERSRSPRREHLWVKVKGGARAIEINAAGIRHVDALLKAVKEEVKPDLNAISLQNLQLFQSKEANDGGSEALRSDLRVAEIAGGEDTKNLCTFPSLMLRWLQLHRRRLNKSGHVLFVSLCSICLNFSRQEW